MQLLRVGDLVEALDLEGQWYPARVMQQASEGLSVLLHFDGWSDSYDEWLPQALAHALEASAHARRRLGATAQPAAARARRHCPNAEIKLPPRSSHRRSSSHRRCCNRCCNICLCLCCHRH